MLDDRTECPQRWRAKRRATLGPNILNGATSAQGPGRKHGLTVAEVDESGDPFLRGAANALRARSLWTWTS